MAISWLPEGTTSQSSDNEQRSLWKIVDLVGGGGGGSGGGGTTVGSGPPSGGVSGDTYWDETNKLFYVNDVDGWNIH